MNKATPIAGTAGLTDLQKKVLAILLAHRFYNRQSDEPTALLAQQEIADACGARQSEISNALAQLAKRKIISKTGKPQMGQPQLYTLHTDSHRTAADYAARLALIDETPNGENQLRRFRAAKNERWEKTLRNDKRPEGHEGTKEARKPA